VQYTSRLVIYASSSYWRASAQKAVNGKAEIRGLEPGQKYPAYFVDIKRQIGAMAEVSLDDPNPTIVLKPCASAKARHIYASGKPVKKGSMFGLQMVVTPGLSRYKPKMLSREIYFADEDFSENFARNSSEDSRADENGVVINRLLVPGATYRYTKTKL